MTIETVEAKSVRNSKFMIGNYPPDDLVSVSNDPSEALELASLWHNSAIENGNEYPVIGVWRVDGHELVAIVADCQLLHCEKW